MRILSQSINTLKKHYNYYIINGAWLGLSQVINALVSFTGAIALAFFLDQNTYGEYRYLLSIAGVIGVFYLSGYSITVLNRTVKGDTGVLHLGMRGVFYSSLVGTFIALIGSVYYFVRDNTLLSLGLLIIGLATPLLNSIQLYNSYLNGKRDFKAISIWGIFPDILSVSLIIITSFFFNISIYILGIYFAANIFSHYIVYRWVIKKYPPNKKVTTEGSRFLIHMSITNIVYTVYLQADKILLFTLVGSRELAIFVFAQMIPMQLRGFQKIIIPLTMPKFAAEDKLHKSIFKKILYLTLGAMLFVSIYIILAPLFFKLFFPKYLESVIYTQVYSLAIIFFPISYLVSAYLNIKEKIVENHIISIITSVFCLIVLYFGITYYGIMGATIASVISFAFIGLVNLYFLVRIYRKQS